jgi:hypothetical protein
MSKRKKKRTIKIRACVQGRKLKGIRKVKILSTPGEFAYRKYVYAIEDFAPHTDVNLDSTKVEPRREYEGIYEKVEPTWKQKNKKKKKKKNKVKKKTYAAQLYSNIGECSDVEQLFNKHQG